MPAAAVIPAPIAYIKVVAVKKLVVGSRRIGGGAIFVCNCPFICDSDSSLDGVLSWVSPRTVNFTLKKLECSKQARSLEYSCME